MVSVGLLDTGALIALSRGVDATALPERLAISAITLAELSVGPLATADEDERAARQALLQRAEADFDPLPFDADAARAFARVAHDLRGRGRKAKARAFDALIAAIALSCGLPVITTNPRDFADIGGLDVIDVVPA